MTNQVNNSPSKTPPKIIACWCMYWCFTCTMPNLMQVCVKPSSELWRLQLIPAWFSVFATLLMCFDCQILWLCRSCISALCCQLPEMQEVGMAQMLAWSRNSTSFYYYSPSGPLSLGFLADSIPWREKNPRPLVCSCCKNLILVWCNLADWNRGIINLLYCLSESVSLYW